MSRKIKKIKRSEGFSLLELVLAVAIFSFSSFALATMIIDSNISTRLSADRIDALLYAKEGVEAVRSIRDNDWTAWASTTNGNYGLSINEASSTWGFSGTSDLIDNKYTRTVNIATDSDVPTSKDVTVNIAWDLTPGRIASTTLLTIFSNWPDVINSSLAVPRGLVSYWSFDDAGAGTAGDSIGGNDGTVTGATATTSVKGIANQAYSFNGSSNYIALPAGASLANSNLTGTVSMWIKRNELSLYPVFYTDATDLDGFWFRAFGNGLVYFAGEDGGNYKFQLSGTLSDTNWHLITGTMEPGSTKLYVDGQLADSVASSLVNTYVPGIGIGGDKFIGYNNFFNGSIDNVRIYRRALTADEVTTIYNSEKP
jgi:Tfp pilus assembly protein PilV